MEPASTSRLYVSRKQNEATQLLANPDVTALLYGGAIRGAKTAWISLTMHHLASSFPNSRACIMRADTPRITTNLLPSVLNFYQKPAIAKTIKSFNKNTLEFTLFNKSTIKLFSESYNQDKTLSRFLGLEMNWFAFDELSEFQEATWEAALVRAGSWLNAGVNKWGHKPRRLVLASCNPSKEWVKKEWYDRWSEGRLEAEKPNWRYVPAKITDNPWVDQEYLDDLKRTMSPMNYQRFVEGDWEYVESQGNEWIYRFDYTRHVKQVAYNPNLPTFLTYDFNVLPYQTLLAFQVEEIDGVWYIRFYDEFCLESPKNNVRDVSIEWASKYRSAGRMAPLFYCGDASGENRIPGFGEQRAFNEVRRTLAPFGLHSSSNRVFTRQFFNEFARMFLNDCFSGVSRGGLPIVVEIDQKRCPTLIKDIQVTLENKDGGFTKVKAFNKNGLAFEKNGHCVDAMKYGFLSVFSDVYLRQYHNKQF